MTIPPCIQFLGGVDTIGGTQIIVQEEDHRVLFDFGMAYSPGGDFFGHRLQARPGAAGLRDLVGLGYLPSLGGLYRTGEAETLGLRPGDGVSTQVFISHLHLDHMAGVDRLADEVPVWMHHDSLRLFRAIAATGERPAVPVGAQGFAWGQSISVGPLRVTPVPVDHDIPGAAALLIETSAGTVVYTGDFRMHGLRPDLVDALVDRAVQLRPKILLIEGTRVNPRPDPPAPRAEADIAGEVARLAQGSPGLALITVYPRNIERIRSIARVVRAVGRRLVISPETAHIYRAMGGDLGELAVYRRAVDQEVLDKGTASGWLSSLFESGVDVLGAEALRAEPAGYLLQLGFSDLGELLDLRPVAGSVFIHSNGEPLGSFDSAFELLGRWLAHFNLDLRFAPSTGHADPGALREVIRKINPEILMPIHSHYPHLLEVEAVRRVLPKRGGTYCIATGERLEP